MDYISTGRVAVPEDFDAYWSSRSKNTRQNVNKARNRVARDGAHIRFESCTDPEQAESMLGDYGYLESAGWKKRLGTAVSRDNAQGQFYTGLLKFLMPGRAMVWRYFFDERLVATDLCINNEGVVYILKTTYDEELRKYSPAFMMHIDGIRYCSTCGFDSIEFYGPAMDWHKKLTDDLRALYHINWYRHALIPDILNLKNDWCRRNLARS
jgi:CelD/BcsL family acetyltransferase involved in cellulose biosynthesis